MEQIGNGMAIYDEPPEQTIHTCPICDTSWLEVQDPEWGISYRSGGIVTDEWPISKRCCIMCASRNASVQEITCYIEENGLQSDFMKWIAFGKATYKPERIGMFSFKRSVWRVFVRIAERVIKEYAPDYLDDNHIRKDFGEWLIAH